MNKKTKKLSIKIFGHAMLMFGIFGFVVVAAIPTLIFFSMAGSFNLEDYGLLMKLILTIIGLIAVILTAFIQVIWLWVLLSVIDSIEEKKSFTESLKYYKDHWNKVVNQNLNKMIKEGIY